MNERGNQIIGLVVVFVATFLAMEFVRDVLGRPVMWVVGVVAIVLCAVGLYRTRNA